MNMQVVSKFGGSSVSSAEQFKKVKEIIKEKENRTIVIVSAIGKSKEFDSKMTDLLFLLHAHIMYSVSYDSVFDMIKSRFVQIKNELNLSYDIQKELEELKKSFNKNISVDFLVSRGEYYTGKLMAEYLGFDFLDSKDLIIFNYNGTVNNDLTNERIRNACKDNKKYVIPGFYGSYPNGEIKLFARGGSDITGSIVAKAVNASLYENWTDVSGILMADPKIVKNPKRIKEITYDELRELSYMGASVLHEETVFPVQELNIPINILNTNNSKDEGTIILQNCTDNTQTITGISGKKDFVSIAISKATGANKTKVLSYTLKIFEKYNINIEHIPSSIDRFSFIVSQNDIKKVMYDIISEIKQNPDIKEITVDNDMSLVAVVGRNMVSQAGISGKIFNLVGDKGINIKMIAQDSHELAIIFGVSNKDMEEAIREIYKQMVR